MTKKRAILLLLFMIASAILAGSVLFLSRHAAKRGRPPKIAPVQIAGVEYRAPNTYKTEGIVEAWSSIKQSLLWRKKIYPTFHIPILFEEDNQWNFIRALSAGPSTNELTIVNEGGGRYILNTSSLRVRKL